MENKFDLQLTDTDLNAVTLGDSNYLNNKGADLYRKENYRAAVEYYRLAASMGNLQAVSNLGYCYLYGRDIERNLSFAIAYLKNAANRKNVDAAYKLGDIYGSDKWGIKDPEMSIYYYRMAVSYLTDEQESWDYLEYDDNLQQYPSLCFALGREHSRGGNLYTDIEVSYKFLMHAKLGYEKALANGDIFYEESYNAVVELMKDEQYDSVRDKIDRFFKRDPDDGEDGGIGL